MIKKILWLCILWWSLLLWYTNAYWLQVLYNWIEWEIHSYPLSTYWNTFILWNGANFLLNWQYKVFSQIDRETDWWNSISYARLRNIFRTENWLYVIATTWTKNSVSTIQTNNIKQWYIHQYCKTTYWTTQNNICSTYTNYNWSYSVYDISTFYENSQYNNPDIILYDWKTQYFNFCFWYEDLNENICFNIESTDCNDYCNTNCTSANSIPQMVNNKKCDSLWLTYNPLMSEFWTNTDTITPIATNSLFIWWNWWWNNNWITLYTWQNYICPTYRQILQNYWANYNTWLCYNWTLKYENWQITTVQKQDIFTVFQDYEEYQQYIYLYNNNCKAPATQQNCENVFNGEREKYSIIANAVNNNVDDKWLWNYCNIALNYDLNTTTCVWNPENLQKEPYTPKELEEYIWNLANIWTIYTPTTWNILNWLIGEGETREDIATRDLFWQIDQIKDKISSIFEERNGVSGIIPDYILWLILTTLLLTVLLKK